MKIGVNTFFTLCFEFEEALDFFQEHGVQAVEVAVLAEPARKFCDMEKLLADGGELNRWLDQLAAHGLEISAFCAHGATLSPDREVAEAYSKGFRQVCKLAEASGVDRLVVLGGLPPAGPGETIPYWVCDSTKAFNKEILKWQWEQRLIPYWLEHGKIAEDHGCKLAVEPQLCNMVYSPVTLMRLREAVGPVIGCNLDPSHLFVQQIDLIEAIKYLSDAIYHVHIKDTRFDRGRMAVQGLLDPGSHMVPEERSWMFTLIGWGHGQLFWRDFLTALRFVGYEGALSIEMESEYIDVKEGLAKSIEFLKPLVPAKPPGTRWWKYAGYEQS